MDWLQTQDSAYINSARLVYRSVRALYRKVRAFKNGLLNLIDRPIIILVYHRVTDLPTDPEMIAVSPENFRRQMEFLQQNFRIVRFEEDWSKLREPAVALTFDDGYADNFLEALPILEDLEVPATIFVATGELGTGRAFWWHQLEAILLRDGKFPRRFHLHDSRYVRTRETVTPVQRQRLYAELCLLMRRIDPERRADWLKQLEDWAGVEAMTEDRHRSMTPVELRRLAASPWVTIGAHTVHHAALSALSEPQQRQEIFSSRGELERLIDKPVTTFSYPFGRRCEYNRTSIRLCREAGLIKSAANFPGQVHKWTDQFQLPRHLVRNWNQERFAMELKRFWTR